MKETLQFTPVRMAEQFMESYRNHELYPTWHYENGCLLKALEELYTHTGEQKYFDYIRELMDNFIQEDGSIRSYAVEEYNLDQINQGKSLFLLLDKTGDEKYRKAADLLMVQLKGQPRTSEGGFWHKKIYPFQMWLDGLYMATPFLTQYGSVTGEEKWFDKAALQLLLVEKRTRDPRSGLLYHAWDESREQRWSSGETGCSPHVWSRAMGWYVMAVVDTLDHLPVDHEQRGQIVGIFERVANALVHVQDQQSGLWPHLLDQPGRERNYLEASGTSMFVYALAKGVRKGYLSGKFKAIAEKGYQGLLLHLLQTDREGVLSLTQCNGGAGLGGTPYRDGSYEYYVTESIRINDPKSVAPFILAGVEMELYKPN